MNIRNPLAAALLLTATQSIAQPTLNPTPNPNLASFYGVSSSASLLDDATFSCSSPLLVHIPYAPCTSQQLRDRESFYGVCPPQSVACKDYMVRLLSGANPAGTIAAHTPPPDTEWASPTCTHIPCALKENKSGDTKKDEPNNNSEVNDAIQGPPQMVDMPEGGPQGKMLQYPSGRVEYCFDNSCSKTSGTPMTPKEAAAYLKNEYADQKQLANSINSGSPSLTNAGNSISGLGMDDSGSNTPSGDTSRTNTNTGGATPPPSERSTPNTPSAGGTEDNSGGGMTSTGDNSPRGLGSDIGGDLGRLGGDSGSSSSSGGGIASAGGNESIIRVNGTVAAEEAVKGGYTYTRIGAAAKGTESIIKGGAATFQSESENGRRDVDSTIGDGSNLGKIQAERQ